MVGKEIREVNFDESILNHGARVNINVREVRI